MKFPCGDCDDSVMWYCVFW